MNNIIFEYINDFVNVYVICRSMGGDLERIITHTIDARDRIKDLPETD